MMMQYTAIWFFLPVSSIVINSDTKVRNFQLLPQCESYVGQKIKTIHWDMPTMKHMTDRPDPASS